MHPGGHLLSVSERESKNYGAQVRTSVLFAIFATSASAGLVNTSAPAAPSAEAARRCMHYSYIAYPYKRPGSVRMSGDRQAYFRDCMAKEGKVPEPTPAKP
jgi:hypothetical protein